MKTVQFLTKFEINDFTPEYAVSARNELPARMINNVLPGILLSFRPVFFWYFLHIFNAV